MLRSVGTAVELGEVGLAGGIEGDVVAVPIPVRDVRIRATQVGREEVIEEAQGVELEIASRLELMVGIELRGHAALGPPVGGTPLQVVVEDMARIPEHRDVLIEQDIAGRLVVGADVVEERAVPALAQGLEEVHSQVREGLAAEDVADRPEVRLVAVLVARRVAEVEQIGMQVLPPVVGRSEPAELHLVLVGELPGELALEGVAGGAVVRLDLRIQVERLENRLRRSLER